MAATTSLLSYVYRQDVGHETLSRSARMTLRPQSLARVCVLLVIVLCTLAGCAPRRPLTPAPPVVNSRPNTNIPTPPVRREIAILLSSAAGQMDVATQLKKLLPLETHRVTVVDVESPTYRRTLDSLRVRPGLLVVAVGLPAARIARDQMRAPVVFAQVFNYQELLISGKAIRGITSMPPLDLQVQSWKKIDSKLRRVGLIVSPQHTELIPQAQHAARTASVSMKHEISNSDRETLYLFKRLAPQIDGLWLVPDDRILSPAVLRELLSYAVSHNVRVCVFSDSLLQWGALMSASPTAQDIARTLHRVLEEMATGGTVNAPVLTQLSELTLRINPQVAGRMGVPVPARESWIVRAEQGSVRR